MESGTVIRRLAAIVIADVVGYTRLMERDDTGTYAQVRLIRDEVVDPAILSHGGRIVKTAGDGLVAEFTSALAALRASIQIQRQMQTRNATTKPDERIDYRIGINLGDIMVEGGDIAGDGVNVASRLEALAEPGGICVSAGVFEQVHGQLDVEFVDGGEQHVKNIARPIRAYRVTLAKSTSAQHRLKSSLRRLRWLWGVAAIGLVIVGGLVLLFVHGMRPFSAPVSAGASTTTGNSATGRSPPLSVAIMPFAASGGAGADDEFSEALTHDVTAALATSARYAWVVSPSVASRYKGKTLDVRAIGRELNVRYLVEGEVRPAGDKQMIATSMVDANTGAQLWNDRFDLSPEGSPAGRDVAVRQIAKGIRIALFDEDAKRAAREISPVASATDVWLRGALRSDGTLNGDRDARKLFEEALQLDPRHVGALIGMASVIATELYLNPQANREQLVRRIDEYSTRAVEADRHDPRAWFVRAQALALQWRWTAGLQARDEVLTIDSGRSDAYTMRGLYLMLMARPDDAFAELNKAIGADPRQANDGDLLRLRCRLHLGVGHYEKAISDCERSAVLDPFWLTHVWLTAAYGQRGDLDKAAAAKAQVLRQRPEFSIAAFKALNPSDVPAYWEQIETHVFPGLRKAGVPER